MSTSQTFFQQGQTKKYVLLFTGAGLLTVFSLVLSCCLGVGNASVSAAFRAWLEGNVSYDFTIIFIIRIPRIIAGLFAGMALAVSGVIIQSVLANPMASPSIIGVNSGAGLSASVMICIFPTAIVFLPLACFLGATAACLIIYLIASKTGSGKLTVALVGIALSSVLSAMTNTLKTLFPDSVYDTETFMMGGFSAVTYSKITPACIVILLCLVTLFVLSKKADVLALGSDTAASLGLNVKCTSFCFLLLACALAGAAVSFSGLLGFVGLLVPHMAKKLVGTRHKVLIPFSALLGGFLVVLCDTFSRIVFAPYEIPVGIIMSVIGGIFFIFLAVSKKGRGAL